MYIVDTTHSPYAKLRPVPISAVTLTDKFWAPRLKTLQSITLPTQLAQCEQTHRIHNFRYAAGLSETPPKGYVFNDSDVYKWLEAVFWASAIRGNDLSRSTAAEAAPTNPANDFDQQVDAVIQTVLAAQQPDGYLNTAFMFEKANQRWTNIRDWHELYCAGHFIQSAIAAARVSPLSAGGEGGQGGEVLQAARKFAELICATFGPAEQGKTPTTPGHQEIELALVELYRLTGERKYLDQAQYFLDARGRGLIGGRPYHQDHKPYRELDRLVGHAVRALYMNIGAADLYMETSDTTLLDTLTRLWEHTTSRRMYVTGGLGARHTEESFGEDYELPNRQAYCETCAAIASVMWNYRMLLITGEARYADLLEHTVYNAVLPGISLDGQNYFYVNPLANDGDHARQPWFSCACCPPNVARLLASLPGYFYNRSDDSSRSSPSTPEVVTTTLWIHLFADNTLHFTLPDGNPITLEIRTEYPWQGEVTITVHGQGSFALNLRIPGWCTDPTLTLNSNSTLTPGTYHTLSRTWTDGNTLTLHLPMPVQYLESHPAVAENTGRVALQRGPLLYCLESADHPNLHLDDIILDVTQPPTFQHQTDLLGGVTTLHLPAHHHPPLQPWSTQLYRPLTPLTSNTPAPQPLRATAIPYYAWANREPGQMRVWIKHHSPFSTL